MQDHEVGIVSQHLPPGYTAQFDTASSDRPGNATPSTLEQESSLKLQGGDIHRDLFQITTKGRLQQRAATFSHPQSSSSQTGDPRSPYLTASEQTQPGGFRREYVFQTARRGINADIPGTRSFVEFLDLYGHFAGEDLAESDTEEDSIVDEERQQADGETRPLLGRRKSSRPMRKGDAGTMKTFFTLLKAFIGTGIMFLPKAFSNGGILFSSITMLVVSLASAFAFHLLLECNKTHGGGYGELGGIISGPKFRALILASIILSQLGFVCAGIVFVAQNMMSFLGKLRDIRLPSYRSLSKQLFFRLQFSHQNPS
jgi:proton-coupled amino acid transporter